MQQIKAAATAATPSPAPAKPPRAPQPFTQTNTPSATPGKTHAKPAISDTEPHHPLSQPAAKPGSGNDKAGAAALIASDAQPSSAQQANKQQSADALKTGASASADTVSVVAGSAKEVRAGGSGVHCEAGEGPLQGANLGVTARILHACFSQPSCHADLLADSKEDDLQLRSFSVICQGSVEKHQCDSAV